MRHVSNAASSSGSVSRIFFQIRNHGRRAHQAADMAYDDATILPQHVSPPGYSSCGTGTHTVSSEPRDGIVERLIAQDPMIIAASSRGVMHTANTARRSPTKSCTSPRMSGIRRKRPDGRRSMSPAPRPSAIAASDCVSRHSPGSRRFRGQDRALWIVCAMANRPQLRRKLAADVHRWPAPAST